MVGGLSKDTQGGGALCVEPDEHLLRGGVGRVGFRDGKYQNTSRHFHLVVNVLFGNWSNVNTIIQAQSS